MPSRKVVLVVGSGGQLGSELVRAEWPDRFDVQGLTRSELDITDKKQVRSVIGEVKPDFVINAAAYTAVDQAETERKLASSVNGQAVAELCAAVAEVGGRLIHISTDYVFDGEKEDWYTEVDQPNPMGEYGKSKLAGEQAVLTRPENVVLRTSWVYGATGSNFVQKIRSLAQERDELTVVSDQRGCPTSAKDLARCIIEALDQGFVWPGLFHLAAPDEATWFDLAEAVVDLSGHGDRVTVLPVTSVEFPTSAKRPANSRLSSALFSESYGVALRPWRDALNDVVGELERTIDVDTAVVSLDSADEPKVAST